MQGVCDVLQGPACNWYPSLLCIPLSSLQNTRKPRPWLRMGRWGLTGKGRRSGNLGPFTPACSSRRWTSASSRPSTLPCQRGQTWQPNWAWRKPRYWTLLSAPFCPEHKPQCFSVFTQRPGWPLSTFCDRTMALMGAKTIDPSSYFSTSEPLMSGDCWIIRIWLPWHPNRPCISWYLNRNSSDSLSGGFENHLADFRRALLQSDLLHLNLRAEEHGSSNKTRCYYCYRPALLFAVQLQSELLHFNLPEP